MRVAPIIPTIDVVIFPGIITPIFLGRDKSIKALEQALINDNKLLLFMQKNKEQDSPVLPEDVYSVGTIVKILQTVKMPDNTIKVLLEGENRVRLMEITGDSPCYFASYEIVSGNEPENTALEAAKRKLLTSFEHYSKATAKISPEIINSIKALVSLDKISDMIAANINIPPEMKQLLLEMVNIEEKALRLIQVIDEEIDVIDLEKKIESKVKDRINTTQRNYYLGQKLKAIKEELGEEEKPSDDAGELKDRIKKTKLPKYVKEKLEKEAERFSKMPPYSSDASVIRSYIETVLELPWEKENKENLDIKKVEKVLEDEHYGLEDVKERIIEYLAVKKLNKNMKGSILCLVGPPGVGKTSLAKSIANAIGRKFAKISLGGVRDEAEIRGHRRTYVGAMPGRIIKEIKHVGTKNPLLLLDEIDKMTMDFRGDPSSALLEVLDPEQNKDFVDHYLDMPFDLSNVFFIATANDLSTIPAPLKDRMEVISIASYTEFEKLNITKRYLIPKSIEENGLKNVNVKFTDETILKIINEYTREAGVRNLKREIDRVNRKVAREFLEDKKDNVAVNLRNLKKYLGNAKYKPDKEKEKISKVGVVNGLAWTPYGGTTLDVQSVKMDGKGTMTLTGKLGEVMKESAQVAMSYVKSVRESYGIEPKAFEESNIHIHFPEGAVPKDGPSAGITIVTAIISVFGGLPVRQDIAMTGEITITGEVLAVGGIKEKVIGAMRVGINEIIIPAANKTDTEELPSEITKKVKFYFAEKYSDVAELVFVDNDKK